MNIKTPLHTDHQLDQLAGQFEHWRQTRSQPSERIPQATVQELVDELMALSMEQGFTLWFAPGTSMQGQTLIEQGQGVEGIAQIRQGLDIWQATGAVLGRPYLLAQLAEACGKGGQIEAGLTMLAETLAQVDSTGERYYEAELYRLKGELLLRQIVPDACQAEACFRRALKVARHQQARSWELRAAMSLSRLWQEQGMRQEARQLTAEVYNWFSEGFNTADLRQAQVLLEALDG